MRATARVWKALLAALMVVPATPLAAAQAPGPAVLRLVFSGSNGRPLPKATIKELCCRDLSDEPVVAKITVRNGSADVELPAMPAQVSVLIPTPGFGEVVLYADNRGKGYSRAARLDFVREAADTRQIRVNRAIQAAKAEGVRLPPDLDSILRSAQTATPHARLAALLKMGEEVTNLRARHRISRLKTPRKGFLLGCNVFGHPARGPEYDRRFVELCNYGTANLYLTHFAPTPETRDYSRADAEIEWLLGSGLKAKTCPPLYFARSVTPEWMKGRPYAETRATSRDIISKTCKHFAGRVQVCEIVNEAHDMSNALELTPEQLVDIARAASEAAREGDPAIRRIINCAHLWGDYAARPDRNGRTRRSPYRYLQDCISAGVNFEIVGLQMYYPEYDLLEIDRMLDRYARLGRPIHITEMGCASTPGIDPQAQRKKAAAGWHGPWTEEMQADWVQSVYTLFYSKPYIEAVSWWDLADAVSFWPYGGLLRGDLSPKPSYERLLALRREWGL